MLPALLPALVATALAAAPVGDLSYGHYLLGSQRPEAALAQAVAALAADPGDIDAHRLYIAVLTRGLREGPAVIRLYRDWVQAEPQSDLARVALAAALAEPDLDPGPWCDEAEAALATLPADPALRARAIRVRRQLRRTCPGDADEGLDELRVLAPSVHAARQPVLRRDLEDRDVSHQDAAAVARYLADWPDPAWVAGQLWHEDVGGEGLELARDEVRRCVDAAALADTPVLLRAALLAVEDMGDDDRAATLRARFEAVDADWRPTRSYSTGTVSWMPRVVRADDEPWQELYRAAARRPSPLALLALRRLEPDLPEGSEIRAEYERNVSDHLWWSLRRRAAVAHARRAYQLEPTPARANSYGYDAALAAIDLEPALAAVDAALVTGPAWDARGQSWASGYVDWQAEAAADRRDLLDTRAWILVGLKRWEEARDDLRLAVLLGQPSAIVHLHLGLVEAELGQDESALLQLSRGLALGGGDEPRLRARARGEARRLLRTLRYSPRGLDAWVSTRWPMAEEAPPLATDPTADWRVGQGFPDLQLTGQDGQRKRLSEFPGLRVVELWATWCGPCVEALPMLSRVAADHADQGVTVLAVSVDDRADAAFSFSDGPSRPAYQTWWAGSGAMGEAKVSGIPTTFVIDEDGTIVAFMTGYAPEDRRLDDALRQLRAP